METRPKKTIKDIITQVEPELFEKLSRLTRSDFKQLDAGVFNDAKMNDAVWKFRSFEEPSLPYELQEELDGTVGGLTLRRDERFAHMIDKRTCERGDELHGIDHLTAVAVVTDNTASASAVSAASPSMRLQRPLAIKVMDGRSGGSTMVTARSR